jgi:hypothetical protein
MISFDDFAIVQLPERRKKWATFAMKLRKDVHLYSHGKLQVNIVPIRSFMPCRKGA